MQKRTPYFILVAVSALVFNNCLYLSKMVVPEEPALKANKEKVQRVKKSSIGFRFLTIPIFVPSGMGLVNSAVAEANADGLVNAEITFSEFVLLFPIFSFPQVTVEGDAVKVKESALGTISRQEPIEKRETSLPSPATPSTETKPDLQIGQMFQNIRLFEGTPGHAPFLAYSSGFDAGGLRIGWRLWRRDTQFFAYPEISLGSLSEERDFTTFKEKSSLITIPITFNAGMNFNQVPEFQSSLGSLNPFVNVGLGYYIMREKFEQESELFATFSNAEWKFNQFGLGLGFGLEYSLPNYRNLSLVFDLKRHFILTESGSTIGAGV